MSRETGTWDHEARKVRGHDGGQGDTPKEARWLARRHANQAREGSNTTRRGGMRGRSTPSASRPTDSACAVPDAGAHRDDSTRTEIEASTKSRTIRVGNRLVEDCTAWRWTEDGPERTDCALHNEVRPRPRLRAKPTRIPPRAQKRSRFIWHAYLPIRATRCRSREDVSARIHGCVHRSEVSISRIVLVCSAPFPRTHRSFARSFDALPKEHFAQGRHRRPLVMARYLSKGMPNIQSDRSCRRQATSSVASNGCIVRLQDLRASSEDMGSSFTHDVRHLISFLGGGRWDVFHTARPCNAPTHLFLALLMLSWSSRLVPSPAWFLPRTSIFATWSMLVFSSSSWLFDVQPPRGNCRKSCIRRCDACASRTKRRAPPRRARLPVRFARRTCVAGCLERAAGRSRGWRRAWRGDTSMPKERSRATTCERCGARSRRETSTKAVGREADQDETRMQGWSRAWNVDLIEDVLLDARGLDRNFVGR